jgi:hypothetical protein
VWIDVILDSMAPSGSRSPASNSSTAVHQRDVAVMTPSR